MQAQTALAEGTTAALDTMGTMPSPGFFEVFGRYIREAREHRKWTQTDLALKARKAGKMSQNTVSVIEKAGGGEKRKTKRGLQAKQIDPLLDALGVDISDACRRMADIADALVHERMDAHAVTTGTGAGIGSGHGVTARHGDAARLVEEEIANAGERKTRPRKSRSRTDELPEPPPPKPQDQTSRRRRTRQL